ncbi:threonine ammonia-lyase [Gryllotalpicola sp.]|uniref:threonine ammonia-lyase n=1 Tax=Gryllotalpicola sp. TaxID=1932787 RepID=UPI002636AE5B|nr:threonine ammonia-lyase [Gryllotalpicola sp.]
MTDTYLGPSIDEIEQAREVVGAVAHVTPLEVSGFLGDVLGAPVYLKAENLQRTGAYKIRGAYYRLSRLSPEERERGVVAASAGNHAQGVALAAQQLGIAATIFMPRGVALPKLQATRGYGADAVLHGPTFTETLEGAIEFAAATGAVFIPPYDHEDIITGQATLGLEILDQLPAAQTIIVPIGGGGLASGVARAAKLRAEAEGRSIRIIGVQAENAASFPPSLAAGEPVTKPLEPTIADGIAVARPGDLTFPIIQAYVDEVVTVTDDDLARALLVLLERAKLVAEPAGAASVAAILAGKIAPAGPTVAIVSGGNIDPLLMQRVIAHGLEASDRYLTLRIMLPDRPGQLATIADTLAEANANVIEVMHTRHHSGLQISQVALDISVETRGSEHRASVIRHLREVGYDPKVVIVD